MLMNLNSTQIDLDLHHKMIWGLYITMIICWITGKF